MLAQLLYGRKYKIILFSSNKQTKFFWEKESDFSWKAEPGAV